MTKENRILAAIAALHSGDPRKRERAFEALSRLKDLARYSEMEAQNTGPFPFFSQDSTRRHRATAARLLDELREPETVNALHEALSDRSAHVRRVAVRALAVTHPPELLEWILPLAGDKRLTVRQAVSAVLLAQNPPPVALICREMATNPKKRSRFAMLEILVGWHYFRKVDVARPLLACADITPLQRWECLGLLSAARPGTLFTSRQLYHPQRFVETLAQSSHEPPEVRQGAQAVLDYLSLGRASKSDFRAERAELMRAATAEDEDEGGSALLRGAEPVSFREDDTASPLETLFARLTRWFSGR